jgi:death-on-curing protein
VKRRLRWLTPEAVLGIHAELIARYGGLRGVRERGLLDSAIARPQHIAAYEPGVSIPRLAAAYGWGLLRNHPFLDGNKRIALASTVVFLDLNGWELTCSEAEETWVILNAASGEVTERAWKVWLERNCRRKP